MRHHLLGLAENPALPPDLLERLIAAADEELACTLACRSDLNSAQATTLAEFDDAAVRLAHDGRLPAEGIDPAARPRVALALLVLACLADRQARPLAARHPSLPAAAIVELLNDEDWQVVEAAAANPSLPRSVMMSLAP